MPGSNKKESIAVQIQGDLVSTDDANSAEARESYQHENRQLEEYERKRKDQEIEKLKLENQGKELDNQRKELEIKTLGLKNSNLGQDINLRLYHSIVVGGFLLLWAIFVGVFLILWGSDLLTASDAVVITIITTTTGQFVGIYLIVANYLFPKPKESKEQK